MGVPWPVMVGAVLLGFFAPSAAFPIEESQSLSLQDILPVLEYLQSKGMNLDLEAGRERGKQIQGVSQDLRSNDDGFQQDDVLPTNKRASYMALCHFKICNMGRKRGSYKKTTQSHGM